MFGDRVEEASPEQIDSGAHDNDEQHREAIAIVDTDKKTGSWSK